MGGLLLAVGIMYLVALSGCLEGLKVTFWLKDVLSMLPWQVSWPVLNTFDSVIDFLFKFFGVVNSEELVQWKGACFHGNNAHLEFTKKEGDDLGGVVVHIKISNAHNWTCVDLYVSATPFRVSWDFYFTAREHTLTIEAWEGLEELEYVKKNGISIFLMPSGMLGMLLALWDVFPLFSNTDSGQNANMAFLKKHMGASFRHHPQP